MLHLATVARGRKVDWLDSIGTVGISLIHSCLSQVFLGMGEVSLPIPFAGNFE